jgi:pimeloyl-ACP methyl ester carboxylesterase
MEETMKDLRIKTNGIELQVRELEGKGEAIVFLHYGGANLMMWQGVVPHLEGSHRLILADLRGHGLSDHPTVGYHIDTMAADLAGIFEPLQCERAHIIGSSLGAEVGLSLAANHPGKVLSLVCDGAASSEFGPYGTWEGSAEAFEAHVAAELEKMRSTPELTFPSIKELLESRRAIFEKHVGWNDTIAELVRYDVRRLENGNYARSFSQQAQLDYMADYYHCRFEDYYRRVTCPLLMLSGDEDVENVREIAAMKELSKLAEQAHIVTIHGWVHPYGWMLTPAEPSRVVLDFLVEQP